jgi:dTDP-4-amino-4,6-dideoxygalactose transaminase
MANRGHDRAKRVFDIVIAVLLFVITLPIQAATALAIRIRIGSTVPSWRYEVVAPGYKYNLTDPAAAMGRVQLRRAREMRDKRAAIARRYDEAFTGLPLKLPSHAFEGDTHAWHLYVVRLTEESGVNRDTFIADMAKGGIGCSVHFIPLHMHPYWRKQCQLEDKQFPVATAEFAQVASLPIFSAMTESQVDRVIHRVRQVLS